VLFIAPGFFMASTAFKTFGEATALPPVLFPAAPQFDNFIEPFRRVDFGRFYLNSIFVTVASISGVILSCTPVAYAFSRIQFRGRSTLFVLVLATMFLPDQVTLIPMYVLFAKLGWVNTFLPLIVPRFFAVDAFIVFLMRQFFMSIPRELDDACKIDGGGHLTILTRILLPLCGPMLGVVLILQFVSYWNDFFWPLVFLSSIGNFTVSLGLRLFQSQFLVQTHLVMAMSFLATLPTVILFFIAQKTFIQGIVLTGANK
jgi:multiple sugar transport system permease protein